MSNNFVPCNRPNCNGRGVWMPTLLLFTGQTIIGRKEEPSELTLVDMRFCSDCHNKLKGKDFVNGENWFQIAGKFNRKDRIPPRRELTAVKWDFAPALAKRN